MRTVPEWIAKHDDEKIPPRILARIFEKYDGRCYLTGTKLMRRSDWEAEHIIALCNGGEHRESNLAPIYKPAHKAKTAADVAIKSKTARVRKKHIGAVTPSHRWGYGKHDKFKMKVGGGVVPR